MKVLFIVKVSALYLIFQNINM